MIPLDLLKTYQKRALGLCVYGNGGMRKTLAARTLVPPIILLDFEGGSGSLGPWTRRLRKWNDLNWTDYSQAEREELFAMVNAENKKDALLKPLPLIDIVSFDTMNQELDPVSQRPTKSPAYDHLFGIVGNMPLKNYNSIALDPLVEFSQLTQTQSKIASGVNALTPMHVKLWQGAQERAAIMLRQLREYRDQGMFIYMTSSEFIDKDYGTDPRESNKKEEPYAIKGTLNVPGQLVTRINHMLDIQFHARMMSGKPAWVSFEEPAQSGSFNWEAKDRTGRIQDRYLSPNFRPVIEQVYGKAAHDEMYALYKKEL